MDGPSLWAIERLRAGDAAMGASDDDLYEAERVVFVQKYPTRIPGPATRTYFEYVTGTKWFRNRWPAVIRRKLEIKTSNHAHGWADLTNNVIYLPPWTQNDFSLLHELAHFCAPRDHQHGSDFVDAHLQMVKRFMGLEAAHCYRHVLIAVGKL